MYRVSLSSFVLLSLLAGCGAKPTVATLAPATAAMVHAALPSDAPPAQATAPTLTVEAIAALVPTMRTLATDPKKSDEPGDKPIPGDPLNVVLVGTQEQLEAAMAKAGWVHPAPIKATTVLKMGWSLVRGKADNTAPVSNLYMFNRPQDLAWEANSPKVNERDHCRAWKTDLPNVWFMAGTKDVGIKWDSRTHGPTHRIAPDIDTERDYIVHSLEGAGPLKRVYQLPGLGDGHPFEGTNGGGDPFHTDGMLSVVEF